MAATTSRHTHWMTMGVFSCIALIALLKDFDKVKDQDKQVKWSVSGISISLALSGLAVFANMLLRDKFVGTLLEGGFATITMAMWAAVLPAIMEPGEIAVGNLGAVVNPNLYFFSWGAFIMSVFVCVGFLKDKAGSGEGATMKDFQFSSWAALVMTSFVTMIAAARLHQDADCDEDFSAESFMMGLDHDAFCDRTQFAVGLGTVSGIIALLWIPLGSRFLKNDLFHALVTWFLLILWVFGVAFITFGDIAKRPAQVLGNLYFFTWGSFAVIASLAASSAFKVFGMFIGDDTEEEVVEGDKVEVDDKAGGDVEEEDVSDVNV